MQMINEQIGSYTLQRELGRGGMGVIYAAEDQTLQRQVAIKIMLQSTGHDALQRFHVEMKAIARLNHKHIVHLYSYGEAKIKETALPNNEITFPYIVMPLYKDGSLDKWLQKAPPLTLEEIAHIISQAADALQHAHDNGIVHRDVKPRFWLFHAVDRRGQIEHRFEIPPSTS